MALDNNGDKADADDVAAKVKEWLDQQGYPTEFRTAMSWQRSKYRVYQGYHVRTKGDETPREIDVLASKDSAQRDRLVRVSHVVECKWSRDKPWVVFTSHNASISPAACITQTIGSLLGATVLWLLAHDERLAKAKMFETPRLAGFGGRQAFSKGVDNFYSAMKSVSSLASSLANEYDDVERRHGEMPQCAVIVFPIIVVDGLLFDASFDSTTDDVKLVPTSHVRCHWRGSPTWDLHATIDVVTLDYLDQFVQARSMELDDLLPLLDEVVVSLNRCFKSNSLAELNIRPAPRGVTGLPALLRELKGAPR